MKVDVLVAEIGSTTTVVNAFRNIDSENPEFWAQGQAPTSVLEGDVRVGLQGASDDLCAKQGIDSLEYDEMLATSSAAGGLKMTVHEWRPDDSDDKAFPSGHSAKAFCGANLVMHEYKDVSPWIGISAYAIAATTATLRVTHKKHYVHDVLAGAAIGYLSTEAAYLMLPLWQKLTTKKEKDDNDKGNTAIAIFPSASAEHFALTGAIVF